MIRAQASLRQFLIAFFGTATIVAVVLCTGLVEHVSYTIEKGRLRALSEQVPSGRMLDELQTPGRLVAELVTPTVVRVETIRTIAAPDLEAVRELIGSDPDFDRNHPWLRGDEQGADGFAPFPIIESGNGSGFIVDAERGYIVTNHHVTDGADRIEVILHDGRRYRARVVGSDPQSDLAVLFVPAGRLHQVTFGDSTRLAVGDDVFALGNPFRLEGTFSRGIVSGLARSGIRIAGVTYQGFIQTDAVINPGNSGGPLVNLRGEVVGVNTAIATRTGNYDGVGFAIPSARVVSLLPQLIAGGRIVRGFLGVVPVDVRQQRERAEALGWSHADGVLIAGVEQDSPASRADLQPGDILLEIDGKPVASASELRDIIAAIPPGTQVSIRLWHDGDFKMVDVEFIARRDDI